MESIQYIGMDLSQSDDCSCISSICSSCRKIIEIKQYDPKINGYELTIFKECPRCGAKLSRHFVNE